MLIKLSLQTKFSDFKYINFYHLHRVTKISDHELSSAKLINFFNKKKSFFDAILFINIKRNNIFELSEFELYEFIFKLTGFI